MSNECSTIVWKRDFGSSNRKLIAARLADHADDEGRGIWPSVERVAAQCNTSMRTVQRVLADFVAEGLLIIVDEGGRGPRSTRRYDFDMGRVCALPVVKWGVEASENKGDTVSPLDEGKGDNLTPKGDKCDEKGCHGVTQTITEPPIEPSSERERASEREETKTLERQFDRIWRAWPPVAAGSRDEARRAWMLLDSGERQAGTDAVARWLAAWKGEGRKYTPALSTYLGEKRWESLPEPELTGPANVSAAPWGPHWAALCHHALMTVEPQDAPPPRSSFMCELLARDDEQGRAERMRRQALHGWPIVRGWHERASNGKPVTMPSQDAWMAELTEPVPVVSVTFVAWQAEYERRGWPWIPDPGRQPVVFFPKGGPDGLSDFEAAIRGRDNDGDGREAAE